VEAARANALRLRQEADKEARFGDMLEKNNAGHKVQYVPRKDVQVALQQLVTTIDDCTYAQKEAEHEHRLRHGEKSVDPHLAAMKVRFDAHLDKMCEVITLLHPEQTEAFAADLARKRRFDAQLAAEDAVTDHEWALSYAATEVMPAAAAADNKRQRQCKSERTTVSTAPCVALRESLQWCTVTHCSLSARSLSECRCKLRGVQTCSSKSCGCLSSGYDCGVLCSCCKGGIACKNTEEYRQQRA